MPSNNRSFVTSLQTELDGLTNLPSVGGLVRVPQHLRSLDEEGYTPRLVSIGPFHHGKPGLKDFEVEKLRCLQAFLSWSRQNLETLYDKVIAGKEGRLQSFYAPGAYETDFVGDSLLKIILVDATFIVAAMLGFYSNKFRAGHECLNRTIYTRIHITRDLALLENQVPLFILTDLYDLINASGTGPDWSFCKLVITFFDDATISHTEIPKDYVMRSSPDEDSEQEEEVRHLVDLLRRYHRPSEPRMNPRGNEFSPIAFRSLTELYECGVKLKLSTSKDALGIRYINGTLEIPKIDTSREIMATLQNMVSFEQCYCREQRYVTDYVNLMANLVRSPDDVELLIRKGILDGWLNQDICKFLYDLGRESICYTHRFYYRSLCEDLDDYCKVPWHMWRATLRSEYFKNPFAFYTACFQFLIALFELVKSGRRIAFFITFGCLGLAIIAHLYA